MCEACACETTPGETAGSQNENQARGITFHVPDMTCGHCAGTVEQALKDSFPGVSVDIDISAARVTVAADAQAAASTIRQAGYSPEQVN